MRKISYEKFISLLDEDESIYLDFKEEHHRNSANLVHDILCLINSQTEEEKYIIFGISNSRIVKGLSGIRKTQADISDCLRSANINRIPEFLLYTYNIGEVEIDILHIKNSSFRPYFLIKDKINEGLTIRAGVIYSRYNDSNTPINGSATETEISHMWMERFGILKNPLEKAFDYVFDLEGWKSSSEYQFFYKSFPEYKLVWESEDPNKQFHEHWQNKNFPNNLARMRVDLFYHSTLLRSFNAVNLDYKLFFPIPRYYDLRKARETGDAYIIRTHIDTYICAIISGIHGLAELDQSFIKEGNIKETIDIYLYKFKIEVAVHSLNVTIEDENVNSHYRYRDLQ